MNLTGNFCVDGLAVIAHGYRMLPIKRSPGFDFRVRKRVIGFFFYKFCLVSDQSALDVMCEVNIITVLIPSYFFYRFKNKHGKNYDSELEHERRLNVFRQNLR